MCVSCLLKTYKVYKKTIVFMHSRVRVFSYFFFLQTLAKVSKCEFCRKISELYEIEIDRLESGTNAFGDSISEFVNTPWIHLNIIPDELVRLEFSKIIMFSN